jgi:hypothetical protein
VVESMVASIRSVTTKGGNSIMHRGFMRYLGLAIVLATAAAAASAQSRTRTVAFTGDGAPGGGVFAPTLERMVLKGLPAITNNTIIFGSDIVLGGQTVYGIFVESGNVARVVTRVGAPAPGGGTLQDITYFSADRFGNVFMTARVGAGTGQDVVLGYTFGLLTSLARVGTTLPNQQAIATIGPVVTPDGLGGAYFQATYGSGDSAIVHVRNDKTFELVAATGAPAPSGGTFGAVSASTLTSSTSGLVGFTATVNGGTSGLFTGLAGNLFLAAPAPDASPNLTIADNDDVEVSFMQPSMPGIKTATLTGTTTFVTNGIAAPRTAGTINFGPFQVAMSADREGSLFFFAPIAGDSSRGAGLFRRDRFTGAVTSIVLQGDPAAGDVSGVYGLFAIAANAPSRIANDDGKVVFAATAGSVGTDVGIFTTLGAPDGLVPAIANVTVKKNKITVVGSNFEPGARIAVNGTPLTDTKNNKADPTHKLQSKTGGSRIAPGATVSITVVNATGAQSAPFTYTRPR